MLLLRDTLRSSSNEFVVHEVMDFQRKILDPESDPPPDLEHSTNLEERVLDTWSYPPHGGLPRWSMLEFQRTQPSVRGKSKLVELGYDAAHIAVKTFMATNQQSRVAIIGVHLPKFGGLVIVHPGAGGREKDDIRCLLSGIRYSTQLAIRRRAKSRLCKRKAKSPPALQGRIRKSRSLIIRTPTTERMFQ